MPAAPAAPPPPAPTPTAPPSRPAAPAPAPSRPAAPAAKAPAAQPVKAPSKAPAAPAKPVVPSPAEVKDPFDQAFEDLNKFSQEDGEKPKTPTPPAAKAKPQPKPEPEAKAAPPMEAPAEGLEDTTEEQQAAEEQAEQEISPEEKARLEEQAKSEEALKAKRGGKLSPWNLVEHYKGQNLNLQREIAELRTKGAEPPKEYTEKVKALETRNRELEEAIAFVDYEQSNEFQESYRKPYLAAWKDAQEALAGLKVQTTNTETGEVSFREMTQQDLVNLAAMPPEHARAAIRAAFPEDYTEVKAHVDKIRATGKAQSAKLAEQKGKSSEWQKQKHDESTAKQREIAEHNSKLWSQFNQEAQEKYEYLRPVDGQDARNEKLAEAEKWVDGVLTSRANDPNMTPTQRAEVIRKHSALRNRAIAFTTLLHENRSMRARVAELEKALADYQASEPGEGEGKGKENAAMNGATDPIEAAMVGLEKYAR